MAKIWVDEYCVYCGERIKDGEEYLDTTEGYYHRDCYDRAKELKRGAERLNG